MAEREWVYPMNLHLMLILLTFKAPVFVEPLEIVPAPQIVCPMTILEDSASLQELQAAFKRAKRPV